MDVIGASAIETDLLRVHAALRSGAGAVEALGAAGAGPLAQVAAQARMGRPLAELAAAAEVDAAGARPLVQALAVAERAGAGATTGVEHALGAIREQRMVERLLAVKTAQARGTARALVALPVLGWVLLVGLDREALRFSTSPLGLLCLVGAAGLTVAARAVSARLVARAALAPAAVDPLWLRRPAPDVRAGVAVAVPLMAGGWIVDLPLGGLVAGALVGAVVATGRRPPAPDLAGGGTAETCELLALALASGLAPGEAVGLVADVGPPAARPALESAHRRLRAGWSAQRAFADTPLDAVGEVLDTAVEWGAAAAPALRGLAADLRAERRAAADEAGERVQLALVLPTTTLTLPAFALAVVPPVVWTGLRGWSVG